MKSILPFKTQPLIAFVIALALLMSTQVAQCFYNPGTGRWLSRDPSEEDEGPSVYILAANDPIGAADALGLKRILMVVQARDTTIPGYKTDLNKLKSLTEMMAKELQNVLRKCKNCKDMPDVVSVYASKLVVSGPPRDKTWHWGDRTDEDLMQRNWNKIGKQGTGTVPVFWTANLISTGNKGDGSGVGYEGKGIILSYFHWHPARTLLAHEVGHYAGYSGGNSDHGIHSDDPNNVMSALLPADTPDEDWCKKVAALLQGK